MLLCSAAEVIRALRDRVFAVLGPSEIVHSDNGTEFVGHDFMAKVVAWCKRTLRGRPYHPQSQGSVESANKEVKKRLDEWCRQHGEQDWTEGLADVACKCIYIQVRLCQLIDRSDVSDADSMNASYHETIRMSPYQCVYGCPPPEAAWTRADDVLEDDHWREINLRNLEPDETSVMTGIPGLKLLTQSLPTMTRYGATARLSATVALLTSLQYDIQGMGSSKVPFATLPAALKEAAATSLWEEIALTHSDSDVKFFQELAKADLPETLPMLSNIMGCNCFVITDDGEISTAIPFDAALQRSVIILNRRACYEAITFEGTTQVPVAVEKVLQR